MIRDFYIKGVAAGGGGVTRSTATLMKTGQTTSFRTGDDGDLQEGRDTDFLTLDTAPLHDDGTATINTSTNRFTDTLGGQDYANDIVLDWSTWNGSTLLGYVKILFNNKTFTQFVSFFDSLNISGFTNWRICNFKEAHNLVNESENLYIDYPPFNINGGFRRFITNTYIPSSNGTSLRMIQQSGLTFSSVSASFAAGSFDAVIPVRTFNLSLSNILT